MCPSSSGERDLPAVLCQQVCSGLLFVVAYLVQMLLYLVLDLLALFPKTVHPGLRRWWCGLAHPCGKLCHVSGPVRRCASLSH